MSLAGETILVTGATGFIGRHVCERLVGDGAQVRGLVRRGAAPLPPGVERAECTGLGDRTAIRAALAGTTAVVHLAGRAHSKMERPGDPHSESRRTNTEGTALVLEEVVAAGVGSFVFASSVKAVAEESGEMLRRETPPQPADAYGESKLEAERLIRVAAARGGLHAPVLRLPLVYGPGMKANMAMLFRAVQAGVPLPLAGVRNRRSFAYVANAVEAIRLLLSSPAAGQGTFYVSDEHDLSTPELIRHIGRALGRPARLFPMPASLLRAGGRFGGLLSRIAGLHFSNESLNAVLGSLFVDTSNLREMTGYRPPVSVEVGMSITAEWFGRRGR